MFVANSSFENKFLSGISSSGDRYYRTMELSGRLTWFIVTCVIDDDGLEMLHSVCCSLDEDLLGLLQPMQNARAVSVQRLVASEDRDGHWETREIVRVWRVTTGERKQILVTEDADGNQNSGPFGDAIDFEIQRRTLVFEGKNALGHVAAPKLSSPSQK